MNTATPKRPRRSPNTQLLTGKSRVVTPLKSETKSPSKGNEGTISGVIDDSSSSGAARRLPFGHDTDIPENVRKVYKIVNRCTGSIGGNAHGGAIYGELTMHSMKKIVDLMKGYTNLDSSSRFIDVGSGLGKPNLYVAQDPGVEFSFGIEMEHVRNMLGLHNLHHVLKEAKKDESIGHRCILKTGNILEASTFDPFTHVYMFDIGFPPVLFKAMAKMLNESHCSTEYLICFHGPRLMIDRYNFNVELLVQAPTKMHGSSEGHTCYIYKRRRSISLLPAVYDDDNELLPSDDDDVDDDVPCDEYFKEPWMEVRSGLHNLSDIVEQKMKNDLGEGRPKRKRVQRLPL